MATNDYSSLFNYGSPLNTQLGSGVYGLSDTSALTGTTTAATDAASAAATPSLMASFNEWLKSTGIIGSTDTNTNTKTDGWGSLALGAAQGLGSAYLGLQQLGVAKDTLANNKAQFAANYAAQKSTTNASLADRQAARVASNPTAYQSVSDYMNQYGIK